MPSSLSQVCAVSLNRIISALAQLSSTITTSTESFVPASPLMREADCSLGARLASSLEEAAAICSRLSFLAQSMEPVLEVVKQACATTPEAWSQKLEVAGVSMMIHRVASFTALFLMTYYYDLHEPMVNDADRL